MDAQRTVTRPVCIIIDVSSNAAKRRAHFKLPLAKSFGKWASRLFEEQSTKEEHTAHPRPTSRLQGLTSGLKWKGSEELLLEAKGVLQPLLQQAAWRLQSVRGHDLCPSLNEIIDRLASPSLEA